jgi:hypothetical protein
VPWSTDGRCVALCRLSFLCGCEPWSRTIHRGRTIHRRQQASSAAARDEMSRGSRVFPVSCPCRASRIASRIVSRILPGILPGIRANSKEKGGKRTQRTVQRGCRDGHILVARCNSGAAPVQIRMHDTIHTKDTRSHTSGARRKTRCSSGAVPAQFRRSSDVRQ